MSLSAGGRVLSSQGKFTYPAVPRSSDWFTLDILSLYTIKRERLEREKEMLNWIRGGGSFNGTRSLLLVGLCVFYFCDFRVLITFRTILLY